MKVASFTIDHNRLLRGIYVSRKDSVGNETVTTFDVRIKRPNIEPPVDIPAIHTLEHLLAVYLRSDESGWADKVIYVGPMGCRTGFYFLTRDTLPKETAIRLVQETISYVLQFEGEIPGSKRRECGNYLAHDLAGAKKIAQEIQPILKDWTPEQMTYPE